MRIVTSLGYSESRRKGSHRRLVHQSRPSFTLAFHDGQTIAPGLVRKILRKDIGLTDQEILEVFNGKKNHKEDVE
ncbi:type II toxin-antitoxin system HicA family toxin [Bifidobacterium sp.]|uniref:type II toxin-antitoxin system HicA family toxin n=1 Tax=Bifidobacterium sp. TaxID=41200 RepID=UPI0039EB4E63